MNTDTRTAPAWWAKVYTAVIRRSDLPRAARLLYCILVGKADATSGAVPATITARWLMSVLGVAGKPAARSAVETWITALVDARLLAVTVPAPGTARVFTVRYPEWVFTATAVIAAEDDARTNTVVPAYALEDDARTTIATGADHFAKLGMDVLTDTRLTREHRLIYALVATYMPWSPQHVRAAYPKARTLARSMGYDVDAADGGRSAVSKGLKALESAGWVRSHAQVKDDGTGTAGPNMLVLLDAEAVGLDAAVAQGTPEPMPGYRFANATARAARKAERGWADAVAASEPPVDPYEPPAPIEPAATAPVAAQPAPEADDDRPLTQQEIIARRASLKALADALATDPADRIRRRTA